MEALISYPVTRSSTLFTGFNVLHALNLVIHCTKSILYPAGRVTRYYGVPTSSHFGKPSRLLLSKAPGNLAHSQSDDALLKMLAQNKAFVRAAGFMSSAFAFHAPKLYREYESHLTPLFAKYPHLKKTFKNSIFPTATFNCGSCVVTVELVDYTFSRSTEVVSVQSRFTLI
ncbi:hypothetical protein L210DRAFT_3654083 [Boletus edulis BED1]|uniref:Uncharacterized protein n=1 Tax=Boletus edulis BED1 TaxID=1328754 RepID=A0AAD4BEF6_BOLED|nr:hypothetical protein L210DRAFT_3654083 [Boletus edulis BED1]